MHNGQMTRLELLENLVVEKMQRISELEKAMQAPAVERGFTVEEFKLYLSTFHELKTAIEFLEYPQDGIKAVTRKGGCDEG